MGLQEHRQKKRPLGAALAVSRYMPNKALHPTPTPPLRCGAGLGELGRSAAYR